MRAGEPSPSLNCELNKRLADSFVVGDLLDVTRQITKQLREAVHMQA
jgi:hypothetical protein